MEPKSILESTSEHDVVEVQNPFDEVFVVKIARSVVVPPNSRQNQPTGHSAADAFMQGIQAGIARGGHTSMAHVQQEIKFEAKQSMRLPGDVAKVAVNQMVREYMQRQARSAKKANKEKTHAMMMADPNAYMDVERLVVKNSESMLTNLNVETIEEKLKRQIDDLNGTKEAIEVQQEEQAFPGITSEPARRGRPAKTEAAQ